MHLFSISHLLCTCIELYVVQITETLAHPVRGILYDDTGSNNPWMTLQLQCIIFENLPFCDTKVKISAHPMHSMEDA